MYNKIVVASDSFKGSLTSLQVADSVQKAVRQVCPSCSVVKVNVADGGEGTAKLNRNRRDLAEKLDPDGVPDGESRCFHTPQKSVLQRSRHFLRR